MLLLCECTVTRYSLHIKLPACVIFIALCFIYTCLACTVHVYHMYLVLLCKMFFFESFIRSLILADPWCCRKCDSPTLQCRGMLHLLHGVPSSLCQYSHMFPMCPLHPLRTQPAEKPYKLTHLQYTAWPDHGVPLHPSSLVKFVHAVRKIHGNTQAPMVVHCRLVCLSQQFACACVGVCSTGWRSS